MVKKNLEQTDFGDIQYEIDHGVLFIDYLSKLKKDIVKKLIKTELKKSF